LIAGVRVEKVLISGNSTIRLISDPLIYGRLTMNTSEAAQLKLCNNTGLLVFWKMPAGGVGNIDFS
jgi:hypothetical protein